MDGLLVVDKPAGPTSHDIVARMRRVLREKRIGHTGTLDPMATGVLALVIGRATRLAQFLSDSDKTYEAVVRLGFATDTGDAQGAPLGEPHAGGFPDRAAIDAALDAFRGTFQQQPPAFSAKKIGGTPSHKLARARARLARGQAGDRSGSVPEVRTGGDTRVAVSAMPAPATVRADRIAIVALEGDSMTLRVDCSAGFYVRSLAHDLGERLGTGAHLTALRRTRSGDATLAEAMTLDDAERDPAGAAARIIPLGRMLPGLARVVLTAEGVRRATHGRELGPAELMPDFRLPPSDFRYVRLLDEAGGLVGIGRPGSRPDLLHPSVVLM